MNRETMPVGMGGSRFPVAKGSRNSEGAYLGEVSPQEIDEAEGLRRIESVTETTEP